MAHSDLRLAIRSLAKRPCFTLVATLTIALGIGANTAIFSVVYAVLLQPLPYTDVDPIVRVHGVERSSGQSDNVSPLDFLDVEARAQRFERVAAFNNYADATLTGAGEPERIAGTRVTAAFFAALGVRPQLGRDFAADDDRTGASPVAMLTHAFWRQRFAADPSVIGRTIRLNDVPTTVVGVLPPSFRHPFPENARQPDVFVPFRLAARNESRSGHYLQGIGRLKPGISVTEGSRELQSIAADLERQYPDSNTNRTLVATPLFESMVGDARAPLLVLLGAVVFVLLIACANLANLFVARATSRSKEIAVRRALGASRVQLVRPLALECLVIAGAAAGVGLVLAASAVRALAALGADRIPRADAVAIHLPVVVFALLLSLAAGALFGLAPAMAVTRGDDHAALREGPRGGDAPSRHRIHRVLIVSEMALALMLLVAAGLLVESYWKLQRIDPGFHAESMLTFRTSLPLTRYPEGDEIPFYQRLEAQLAALPGVRAVGATQILPFSADYSCDGFQIDGRPPFRPGEEPCAEHRTVTPGYFAAMGIPLLRGRTFAPRDTADQPGVAIVSENMAARFWPGEDPVGRRIRYQRELRTIVGIAGDVKHFGLDRDAPFEMYTPHAQQPSYHSMTIVVRTPAVAASIMPAVRHVVAALDRDIPISDVATMQRRIDESTTEPRFRTLLVGTFAALALLLAIVGVAGVTAYTVGRRTQEIGVRVALGATPDRVTAMMLAEGLRPTLGGVAIGLVGATAFARVLSGMLFGVAALDPFVFAASAGVLVVASLAATFVPARRAAVVDPMVALRAD